MSTRTSTSIIDRIINRPMIGYIAATPEELRSARRGAIVAVLAAIVGVAFSQGAFPLISRLTKIRLGGR